MSNKKSKKSNEISDEEQQFFRDEVADVRPLKTEKRIETIKNKPSPKPRDNQDFSPQEGASNNNTLSDPVDLREAAVEDVLFLPAQAFNKKCKKNFAVVNFPLKMN